LCAYLAGHNVKINFITIEKYAGSLRHSCKNTHGAAV
jgi:hypothetical protein